MKQEPLVAVYLTELDQALTASDPQERADTLAAVREHIADALAAGAEPAGVLDGLGPVDRIAAATTPRARTQSGRPAYIVLGIAVLSLFLALGNPFVAIPLAIAGIAIAGFQLPGSGYRGVLWTAIGAGATTLVVTLALGLSLLSVGGVLERGEGHTVEPLPADG